MSNNLPMHAVFPIVLFGSIALFVLLGVLSMFTRGSLYDQVGQGGLTVGEDRMTGGASVGGPTDVRQREQEIRQMLQARSDRLVSQGQAPLDIDAELAKLEPSTGGGSYQDAGLAAEVRQLVLARNERRARQGQPMLDVETEVARTLAELGS